jgi:hypothetical protein
VSQDQLGQADKISAEFGKLLHKPISIVCATLEQDMMELQGQEKADFIKEIANITHDNHVPTLDDLIRLAFDQVGLMYYFTAGEKECRARAIPKASSAPQAAGAIHTDFIKKFIKAEVIKRTDFVSL